MIFPIHGVFDLDGTADRTVVLFRAPFPGRLLAATWGQELAVDGAKVISLRNATRNVAMTAALTINGLGALGGAAFVLTATNRDREFSKGDIITAFYDVTTAGTVAAGEAAICAIVQYGQSGELMPEL